MAVIKAKNGEILRMKDESTSWLATNAIRFVRRNGKNVLQQAWQGDRGHIRWGDVPTEEE